MSIKSPLDINMELDLAIDLLPATVYVKLSKSSSQCKQELVIKVAGRVPGLRYEGEILKV